MPQLGGRCWAGPRGGDKSGELLPGMGGAAEPALLRALPELAGGIAWALSGHRACPRLLAGGGSEQLLGIRRCRASRVFCSAAAGKKFSRSLVGTLVGIVGTFGILV